MAAKRFSIEAVFKAIDKMSNPLRGMNKNTSRFSRALRTDFAKAQRRVDMFSRNVKTSLTGVARNLTVGIGVAATGALALFIKEASKIEDAVAGFTPLLGGVEKANELVDGLNKTAATTPFQFDDISKAAKQLLPVMNQDIEKTISTFRMLGDTAGGNAQKLDSITRGFTKAMLKNKVDMEALNMIAEAGVPIYTELSKSMGVSVAEMMKMSSAGKISASDLEKAFKTMTSEGGIFFKGMEIASLTLSGKLSTLKDNIALTAAGIGKVLSPIIKPLIDRAIEMAGAVREWVNANQGLIFEKITTAIKIMSAFLTIAINIISTFIKIIMPISPIILGIVSAMALYKAAMTAGAIATGVLNAVMNANPIGLIITGIGILIGLIILMVKHWDKVSAVLKKVGAGLLEFILVPVNMVIDAIQGLLILISKIPGIGDKLTPAIEGLQEFQNMINPANSPVQSPVTPAERASITREESFSSGELTIRDETGRAEMTKNPSNNNFKFNFADSGAF